MKRYNLLTIASLAILLLTSMPAQAQFDEFEDFPQDFEQERPKMSFEDQLFHIRSIMVERDEQAVIAGSHRKLDKALYGFLQTDFMVKYKELKLEAESLAATFKAQSTQIPPEDVARVKKAYVRIADQFNLQLEEIKRDFMDKKKLKLIRDNRDMYSNSLQYKLRELKDAYSQDFERVVAEVTGSDMYSAVPLAAIFGLIKLAKDFTEFLARSSYEARRVKEEHLERFLMEPYKFRSWIEIEMLEGDIYNQFNQNGGGEYMDEEWNDIDPFIEEQPDTSNFDEPEQINN